MDLYQECSHYSPGVKNGPSTGVTCFTYTHFGKKLKIFLCETRRHRPLIFGMSLYRSHILCEKSVSPNEVNLNAISSYCRIQTSKVFQTSGYHTYMFHFLKMLPKAYSEQIVSGELQDHWSSGLLLLSPVAVKELNFNSKMVNLKPTGQVVNSVDPDQMMIRIWSFTSLSTFFKATEGSVQVCLCWGITSRQPNENDRRKYFMINHHERMLPTSAGIEPAISDGASNWATEAGIGSVQWSTVVMSWIPPPPAGFKPKSLSSKVGSANHLSTHTLLILIRRCTEQHLIWVYSLYSDLSVPMLNPDISCLCKQCRSRSVGFWRSQLNWICTVSLSVCEFIATIRTKQAAWPKIRNGRGIFSMTSDKGQGKMVLV